MKYILAICSLIVIVFCALMIPALYSTERPAGRKSQTIANLKQLSLGVILYTGDFDDRFPQYKSVNWTNKFMPPSWNGEAEDVPPEHDWTALIQPYEKGYGMYRSPSDHSVEPEDSKHPNVSKREYLTSFTLNAWAVYGLKTSEVKHPENWVLMGIRNNEKMPPATAYIFHWWRWANVLPTPWPADISPNTKVFASRELIVGKGQPRGEPPAIWAYADGHAKAQPVEEVWSSSTRNRFWPYSE